MLPLKDLLQAAWAPLAARRALTDGFTARTTVRRDARAEPSARPRETARRAPPPVARTRVRAASRLA
jgi:hypothetical protein